MSNLGPVNYDYDKARMFGETTQLSNDMLSKVDTEVRRIMEEGYLKAQKILKSNKNKLDAVASVLLQKETLEGDEFDELMKAKDGERKKITKKPASRAS
jgi:cell division protease FtsH